MSISTLCVPYLKSVATIAVVFAIAYCCSSSRSSISFRKLIGAFGLQWLFGFIALKTPVGQWLYRSLAQFIDLINLSVDSSLYTLFGNLGGSDGPWGVIYFVRVIPLLIFIGAFFTLFFHWGIVQRAANGIAWALHPILQVSAVELVCALLNAFLGQVETPLLMKDYLKTMRPQEVFVFMVSGMGVLNIALIVIYASIGVPLMHLLAAALMGIPGSIMIAKILFPDEAGHVPEKSLKMPDESLYLSSWDALYHGTLDGIKIGSGTVGMLITCISMIALMNFICSSTIGFTLDQLFAYAFAPVAYLIGVPSGELLAAGTLLGKKTVINEYVAYAAMLKTPLSDRAMMLLTYALAGFANITSIGVQVAMVGAFAPEQRATVSRLGLKALLGAILLNLMNAAIAGILN